MDNIPRTTWPLLAETEGAPSMDGMTQPLISLIQVDELFGLYTYQLPHDGVLPNAAILYGDNGIGKTTILRLAFHLLSAAGNKGHRTALFGTPFKNLSVELSSGVTLTATRDQADSSKPLILTIFKQREQLAIWEFLPTQESGNKLTHQHQYMLKIDEASRVLRQVHSAKTKDTALVSSGEGPYLSALAENVPTMFMLNADRRLDSDSVADPSDELELRRVMMYEEPKRLNELVARSREIALSQAFGAATSWIGTKAVQGANRGSMNVHSVYLNVIRHLVGPSRTKNQTAVPIDSNILLDKLTAIESRTAEHAHYELATPLSTAEFRGALSEQREESRDLAASLLAPYVESLERRLEATDPIYRIVDRLVTTVNGFLTDKVLSFKLGHGFMIQNRLGNDLKPTQLSSGEQQLLLLFCYIITGRDKPSVFMIDEPEISLNIKWQRQLVQALMDIAYDSPTQFLFASHSLELISQHRDRVVRLIDRP